MKNIIIAGASGMIGKLILEFCLQDLRVQKITSIVRTKSGIQHDKLIEIVHKDFNDFTPIESCFNNQDVCFYCVGVYTGAVSSQEFKKITVDYTRVFAETLKRNSPHAGFCFLSGQGADLNEKSKILFAREKGIAENILINTRFDSLHIFRPGYIYPSVKRKEPNLMYRLLRILYKPLSFIYPNIGTTSIHLATTMFQVGLSDNKTMIFENNDIRNYA